MSNPCSRARVNGFVRAQGTKMVNGLGEQIVLRGWGAGNWMNPEGFMVGGTRPFDGAYNRPKLLDRARSMDWLIRELCGSEYAKNFWPQWYRRHLGRRDIEAMAELGYNSVRLVLNAAALMYEEPGYHFNEDTFEMLTQVLDWCEAYKVYAILDLHAAPGGQSCGGCDDGVDNVPHLFLDAENRERCIVLWEEIARRYADRWIVAGYDLLNEPINDKNWHHVAPDLASFYDECIARIRAIDKKHMFTLEGMQWSTMLNIFDHDYDPTEHNWCIHVHNYGFVPELNEIMADLERAEALQVPIWMGEGGSGNKDNAVFLELLAKEGIGFALWCWKSANPLEPSPFGRGAPAGYNLPEGWKEIFDYADHGGPKPSYARAQQIFDALLEQLDYDKCSHPEDRHQYVLRQPGIVIPGVGYDHGEPGVAFSGSWTRGNVMEYRLVDRTKLVRKPGSAPTYPKTMKSYIGQWENPLDVLWLEMSQGDFVHYTIRDVVKPCPVTLTVKALSDTTLTVSCGEESETLTIAAGEPITVPALTLPAGEVWAVRVQVESGTVQIVEVGFGA